jgi:hypothetical protein
LEGGENELREMMEKEKFIFAKEALCPMLWYDLNTL